MSRRGVQVSRSERTRVVPRVETTVLRGARGSARYRTLLRYGVRPFLVVTDVLAWAVASTATGGVRGADLVLLALVVGLYASAGLYRSRLSLSVLDDAPGLCGRAITAAAVSTTVGVLLDESLVDARLVRTSLLLSVTVLLLRTLAYGVVRKMRARGYVAHPTLVLGAGRVGGQVASLLLERPSHGLQPVGFLDSDPLLTEHERPVPLLGDVSCLASVIVEFGVRDVVVAFGSRSEADMVDVIRTCDRLDVEIFFVPRLFELHSTGRDMDQVWGVPLVRLRRAPFRSTTWKLKRVFDVVLSGTALLALAPLLALLAAAVRWEGGPGILFRQQRVGVDGRPFELMKFRSLRPVDETESATRWNVQHDDRLGPVGKRLRATSLDELPQLWNVLRGDMSLVGPRPERPHFVSSFAQTYPRYAARHRVPAGLTGWAQVHGLRGDTSIAERARFDNYYIENWSLWLDVKIVLRTVLSVLRSAGG
ncbi:MAG: exopolysaccharide biosynthesis polyprenyl glycosylphosphotransferase [Frankiales bacterium]|nr:exopolysaccharide biosynthesis polyprenyl glycosylphosphotransferase [Frankiales bacterium]